MSSGIHKEVLGLQISMNVAQLVKGIDRAEHFGNVETSMSVGEHTGVVKQGAEITTRHILHGKIDTLVILERVEQSNKPLTLRRGKNIAFCQDMANLVELEQQLLAHHLQSTNFACVLFLGQKDLSISSLANLCEDLEIALSKPDSSFSKIGTFSAGVFVPHLSMVLLVGLWWRWIFGLEGCQTLLSGPDIGKEIEVVIEEICSLLEIKLRSRWAGIPTELGDIDESANIGSLQNLSLFSCQAS